MGKYFEFEYAGAPFELFGPAHIWTVVALAVLFVVYLRAGKAAGPGLKTRMRISLVVFLLVLELVSNIFWALNGVWSSTAHLPFHMCSAMTYVMAYAFLTENRRLYPLVYLLGIAGAIQAIITPDAQQFGYPHFRFWDSMFSHAGLVLGGLWVVMVEGVRPTFRNLVETFVGLNVYALLIFFVNRGLNSNYLYVNGKPQLASAMDLMPTWPYYILVLEAIVLVVFVLMYLPFRRSTASVQPVSVDGSPG
jgi:hypothetical integral membrane protein (TIGR02206 family)